MSAIKYQLFETKTQLARHFANKLMALTQKQEKVFCAISGGSTPQHIFDVMASEYANTIEWHKLVLFWVDERCVPISHPDSNFRMTDIHLLSKVSIPAVNIVRVKTELGDPKALEDYIEQLDSNLPKSNNLPQFDLTVLGMGDDGHTASIFPHEIGLWQSAQTCVLGHHPQTGQVRVSLSGQVINNSTQIVFLVTGRNKAEKVKEIFDRTENSTHYPASLVDMKKTEWLLDADAAAYL